MVAVGDKVRVHYHPPGQTQSFVEGLVTRADVTTELGRMFVIAGGPRPGASASTANEIFAP